MAHGHRGILNCLTYQMNLFILSLQVIAIVMDMFTDVDILKETVDASIRGVPVYVLLDDFHLKQFLTAAENQDIKLQQLRVSHSLNVAVCLLAHSSHVLFSQ